MWNPLMAKRLFTHAREKPIKVSLLTSDIRRAVAIANVTEVYALLVPGVDRFQALQAGFAKIKLCAHVHTRPFVKIYQKVRTGIKFPVLITDNVVYRNVPSVMRGLYPKPIVIFPTL
jgi:hypothetical protein